MMMNCPTPEQIFEAVRAADGTVTDHVRDCARCRAIFDGHAAVAGALRAAVPGAAGDCLPETQLIQAARSGASAEAADHLSRCADCRREVADLVEALEADPGAVPARLKRSILDLVPQRTSSGRIPKVIPARLSAPRTSITVAWVVGAAAAVIVAVLLFASLGAEPGAPPTVKKSTSKKEEAVSVREEPKPVIIESKKEEPKLAVEPRKEEPKPLLEPRPVRKKDEDPVAVPAPKEEPKPVVTPKKEEPKVVLEPKKTEIEGPKYTTVTVAAVYGPIWRGADALALGAKLSRSDRVATGARQPARLVVGKDYAVALDKGASLQLEQQEGGETRVTLSGTAFFEVEKRTAPFVIRTPHADAIVVGTSFQVQTDEKRTTLSVLEGAVRFKNEKGETLVKASQRSTARSGEKPSSPAKADVDAETGWRKRPDLSGNPAKEPFLEHSPGGNKKLPGLVLTSPYTEWEIDSGRLARATAELLDAALLQGHFHREKDKKIWMNVDRGTEGDVKADGTVGPATSTDRAKKVTVEYLAHLRGAAGVTGAAPVPMVVNFRDHSEMQGADELEVCEVAWNGFNPKTIEQLKAFYAQLLDKHKPAYRLEMRFDRIDETYDYKGRKRRFMFTESDAKGDGYMAPRNSQASVAFFFNPSFGNRPEDFDVYSRILAEMVEFLYSRRR